MRGLSLQAIREIFLSKQNCIAGACTKSCGAVWMWIIPKSKFLQREPGRIRIVVHYEVQPHTHSHWLQ
jgi:hypothetical protein